MRGPYLYEQDISPPFALALELLYSVPCPLGESPRGGETSSVLRKDQAPR